MYLYKCMYYKKNNLSPVQLEYRRAENKVMAYTEFYRRQISDGWNKDEILQDAEIEIIRDASHNLAGETKITSHNK